MAETKYEYYAKDTTASAYIRKRYGGRSGRYVNLKELAPLPEVLSKDGRILDMPCGAGRVSSFLLENGFKDITGADYSQAMLNESKAVLGDNLVKADAFNLPFENDFFMAVVSLRFVFHYAEILPFLREAKRVLKPSGVLVFETYRWSPLVFDIKYFGGKVHIHSDREIIEHARSLGMDILYRRPAFLFSPYVCAKLPRTLLRCLDVLEKFVPDRYLYSVTWALKKR